jgi:chemotaxis protein MotA
MSLSAAIVFDPELALKRCLNKQELLGLEIVIRGVMDIQSGEHPRVIQQKLTTFLPPRFRNQAAK